MKVILSKQELERTALLAMRRNPGCESLKAVDVEYADLQADTNWTLYARPEGRLDPVVLRNALEGTVSKLKRRYELAPLRDLVVQNEQADEMPVVHQRSSHESADAPMSL
jgi:hypothetical protein